MTATREGSFTSGRWTTASLLVGGALLFAGCAPSLLERAIAARGGSLSSISRDVEAEVYAGFPGSWRWRFDYRVPDRLRWTLETYGDEQSFTFDGATVRLYLGSARVAADPHASGGFRSQVRWLAVTTLDALDVDDGIAVRELTASELPSGMAAGLQATYRDDGARYTLYFDDAHLLVAAEGPMVIPTVAAGEMRARFADFREASGYLLPHRGAYTLDAKPLFDERVLRYVPNDRRLTADSFSGPPPGAAR